MSVSTDKPADIQVSILAFLESKTKSNWDVDRDLFGTGGLPSLFAMELVVYLEKTFSIAIGGTDLRLDNFRTVTTMANLVARLRGNGGE